MQPAMIYIVSDGKPGHLSQSQGLAKAIGRLVPTREMTLMAEGKRTAPQPYKDAGLILAAGRQTHGTALQLRRYLGVPAVCLMNPGIIGRQRFDLAIIPRHDGVRASARVIVTDGALNAITPAKDASSDRGLLLIGGPSKHHRWDDVGLQQQLRAILERDPQIKWTVTGSRRTPDSTDRLLHGLAQEHIDRFTYTPASQTPEGWVAEQLQRCGVCWVSEDSVSMVYESLTAGAAVGLIQVPRKAWPGRVVRGVQSLIERRIVTPYDQWQEGKALGSDRAEFAEANRVAKLTLERWPVLNPDNEA